LRNFVDPGTFLDISAWEWVHGFRQMHDLEPVQCFFIQVVQDVECVYGNLAAVGVFGRLQLASDSHELAPERKNKKCKKLEKEERE